VLCNLCFQLYLLLNKHKKHKINANQQKEADRNLQLQLQRESIAAQRESQASSGIDVSPLLAAQKSQNDALQKQTENMIPDHLAASPNNVANLKAIGAIDKGNGVYVLPLTGRTIVMNPGSTISSGGAFAGVSGQTGNSLSGFNSLANNIQKIASKE
jgi:hypothetical protein